MNGYQKLRERIKRLEGEYDDLFQKFEKVIENPNSEESKDIKQWVKHQGFMRLKFTMYSMTKLLEAISVAKPSDIFVWNTLNREEIKL